jgi:hypothetical protein
MRGIVRETASPALLCTQQPHRAPRHSLQMLSAISNLMGAGGKTE